MARKSSVFSSYWQMRMASAEHRLQAALQLISHKPTRGTLAEDVLREIISAFLPGQWAAQSGFIVDQAQQPSCQLDIIVYNQLGSTPLYRDENVVVLPVGTRPIAVEVKSVLNKEGLFDAMENLASLKAIEASPDHASTVLYAFRGFAKPTTIQTHLMAHLKTMRKEKAFRVEHLPDMICVQEQKIVVVREAAPAFRLVGYRSKAPIVQSLLTQVLNALRDPVSKEQRSTQLYSLLPRPAYDPKVLFTIN